MEEELSIEQMKEILLKDPHIIAVHYDSDWDVPKIDDSLWDKEKIQRAKKSISNLETFLSMPYIEDIFGTKDNERREWKRKLVGQKDLYNSYSFSCLRYASISCVVSSTRFLKNLYRGKNEAIIDGAYENINSRVGSIDYYQDPPTFQQRVEAVKAIKKEVYDLLVCLSREK